MNYLDFHKTFYPIGCFHINQIYAWYKHFDKNNLTRWVKKELIVRLKQGFYTFPDYKNNPGFSYFIANTIYNPSYISLHTALSYYGIIPEAVVQITSVTTLKTATFNNDFGTYSYKSIKKDLMFAYELLTQSGNFTIKMAQPEKALLDLLYLYPFYNSVQEMLSLRLDEDFIREELNLDDLMALTVRFKSKALSKRVRLLLKAYEL